MASGWHVLYLIPSIWLLLASTTTARPPVDFTPDVYENFKITIHSTNQGWVPFKGIYKEFLDTFWSNGELVSQPPLSIQP